MIVPQIRIALPTKSVFSTEPRDYAFNSNYATVRIYLEGKSSVSISAGSSQTITVSHNLGFVPMAMVFTELATGHYYNGCSIPNQADGFSSAYLKVSSDPTETYVNTTSLVFKIYNYYGSTKTPNYCYYIFADNGI